MISIRENLTALERAQQFQAATLASYIEVMRAAGEYPVELVPSQTGLYQQHLRQLERDLHSVSAPEDFGPIHTSFREELRLYRDQAREWVERMHDQIRAAAEVMQQLAARAADQGSDQDQQWQAEMRKLNTVGQLEDLAEIRRVVAEAAAGLARTYENMREADRLLILELQDEIHSLHREIEKQRRTLYTDEASGAWNRSRTEKHLEELFKRGEPFSLIVISITNLKRLARAFSAPLIEKALREMGRRIATAAGPGAKLGRWDELHFLVFPECEHARPVTVAAEMSRSLAQPFVIQQEGRPHSFSLRASTTVVEHPRDGDPAKFRTKLASL